MSNPGFSSSIRLLVLMLLPGQVVDFPNDLNRWKVTSPPEEGSEQWFIANSDTSRQWMVVAHENGPKVSIREGRQEASKSLPFEIQPKSVREGLGGERVVAKTEDGWIVGFDAGEFGGGLWWFSPDGKRRQKISDDNVIDLIPTASGLLSINGVAHGGVSTGRILRLSRKKEAGWFADTLVDLGHAPEIATKDIDGSMVIATSKRLIRVSPASKKIDVLLGKAFWGGLYPNSMVITKSGTIYIGMRHGIARIEKVGINHKVHWLLPP